MGNCVGPDKKIKKEPLEIKKPLSSLKAEEFELEEDDPFNPDSAMSKVYSVSSINEKKRVKSSIIESAV